MAIQKLNFPKKVTNGGATPSGILTSAEFNQIPSKIDEIIDALGQKQPVAWSDIENKPTIFPPSAHTHVTDDIIFKPTDNETINGYIQELYFNGDYQGDIIISQLEDTSSDTRIFFSTRGGILIGRCVLSGAQSFEPGKVYEIEEQNDSGLHGYIVFSSGITTHPALSGLTVLVDDDCQNIAFSPTIFKELMKKDEPVKPTKPEWTNNETANATIAEIYYPDMPSGATITLLRNNDDEMGVFIGQDGFQIAKAHSKVNADIRKTSPIFDIYDGGRGRTHLGYIIFEQNTIPDTAGPFTISSAAKSLDNCPRIKAMLESKKQLILLGDSIPSMLVDNSGTSHGQEQPLAAILRGVLGCQVINLCCHGTTYCNRGDDFYDAFSGVAWVKAISTMNYSAMQSLDNDNLYPYSYANTTLLRYGDQWDTTIICEYGTNDYTGSYPLGTPYSGATAQQNTVLGGMTLISGIIQTKYPTWKLCYVNLFNRRLNSKTGTPIFISTNSAGMKAQAFAAALADNAMRLGVPIIPGTSMPERSTYALSTVTGDGTHNNQAGFYALASFYAKIYRGMNLSKETALVVSQDVPSGDSEEKLYTYVNTEGWTTEVKDGHTCWKSPDISGDEFTTIKITPNKDCYIHIYSDGESSYDYLFVTDSSTDTDYDSDYPRVVSGKGTNNQRKWLYAALAANTDYYVRYTKDFDTDEGNDCGWFYLSE